ncbi:mitochondrial 54S ribosomal protein rml2 [Entomophthora muscae]|uniref:Mitochondrial 54S ribosomal protein rml2 n=2 Tax=Entomophthora muscae TaxID=34485 RepID=A0ACC2U4U7_9FUNG|nr:mitochondrial 54S ribosomal protein rml2 [Entomophthora muscae]KAJ9081823.1 mitochondrial 54S ribosomal protein rml2 [Entomophthora muscae]
MFSLLARQVPRLWTPNFASRLATPLKCNSASLWSTAINKPQLSLSSTSVYLGGIRTKKTKVEKPRTPLVRIEGNFKTFKPITSGLRFRRYALRDHLWKGKPMRKLTVAKRKSGGRNNSGRITVRHIGGGHRQRIRLVDFNRHEPHPCEVERIEYDPGRSAHIALIRNLNSGKHSYIIAPHTLMPGMIVESFRTPKERSQEDIEEEERLGEITRTLPINIGNCMPLRMVPTGTIIHCVGLRASGPAQMVRTAGNWAQLVSTGETGYAHVRLSSGETRKVPVDAICTIGKVSNPDHQHRVLGKAGASRHLGIRPSVRGMAMNPCDHPHGGGRGKSKGGNHPVSPWGVLAKGGKTRKRPNPMVVKPRPRR